MADAKSSGPKLSKARPTARPATIDLRQPMIVLRAHILVALALATVACSLLAWQMMRQPKLYSATATLVVERGETVDGTERGEFMANENTLLTRLEQLRSPDMLQRLVASMTEEERARILTPYGPIGPDPAQQLARLFRGSVTFERKGTTMLMTINVVHLDSQVAALIANRAAEQAVRHAFESKSANTNASLTFLRTQAEDMRKKAEQAERALQEYRQRFNLVSLEANQNIIVDNLKSLNASATAAQVARVSAEVQLEQAEAILKRGEDAGQLASITGFESLGEVARRLTDLRAKRVAMSERYGRRHPAMQENERAIESVEKLRDEHVQMAITSLRDQRDKALSEERQLGVQRAKAEKEALDLDQLGVEYNILRRAVESHKASYSQILARLNDATVSTQLRGATLQVSELATPPAVPFSPNPRKTFLIATGLAVVILFGYPFSAEMFFGRIRSAGDVEFHLGADLLGEIGSVKRVNAKDRPTLVKSEHDEAASEQFRALYSQLALTSKIDPPKTILITSTMPGEGKSFIAANLAESFVAHGRRVLLVDADLRRPTQHRNFGIKNDAGIVRWIEEEGAVGDGILQDPKLGIVEVMPGLFVLRAGGLSRKATELMESGKLSTLLSLMQRKFDIVIIDTPPVGVFPDALAFARSSHELIYICRFNTAARQTVRECLERLRQTGLEMPGVVLNAMPSGFGGSYYYKGYSYQRAKYYSRSYGKSQE